MLKIIRVIFAITLFFSVRLNAQVNKLDSLATVLENYASHNKSSVLFIHFDKNIYANNDQVWFTGYILKSLVNLDRHNTLYLSLVSNADSSVVLQQKFLIDKGYAFGSLTLPDSLQSGTYRFIANTNIKMNGRTDAEFIQPITIKSTTINPLIAHLSLFKSKDEKTGNGTALLKVLTSDNHFVADAEVSYTIGRPNKLLKSGKAKTSIIGEVMIDYPAEQISPENNLISVLVKRNKQIRYQKFEIPLPDKVQYQVSFYPEGGYMISGITNNVGLEVKDSEGTSVMAKAIVYAGNKIIDTVSTSSSGLGNFFLTPQYNQKYTLKLLREDKLIGNYELPASLEKGANIKLNSAIGNNELRMLLESNINGKAHLVVHNYETIYLSTELDLNAKKPLKILLKLDSVSKGINTITLLDDAYKPFAERIFFAHYDQLSKLQVKSDKDEFFTRDSVWLKLNLFSEEAERIGGMVSVGVVQANRLSLTNNKNIVDYSYLENELGNMPPNASGIKYDDIKYLDDMLLVKAWRKYKWPEKALKSVKKDTISEFEYSGQILNGKKSIKKPLSLNVIAANNISAVNTDSIGKFVLPYQSLIADQKAKVWLNINDKNISAYNIKFNNPFDEIKSSIKTLNYKAEPYKMGVLVSNDNSIFSSGIKLNEVTIKKSKDNSLNYASGFGVNACGDYVCSYGILNCPNHSSGTLPVKGRVYLSNGDRIVYQGCSDAVSQPNFLILNGISYAKDFYVSDIKNKNEPINFATVYWNYQFNIDKKGENPLVFTTGDLTGDFKITIQGISDKGPVYGEKMISIKSKSPDN